MAPNQKTVELQTREIIRHLLEDDDKLIATHALGRCLDVETDSPAGSDDGFNAVEIAEKLRSIADSLKDNVVFSEALNEFKKQATKEAIEAAFNQTVRTVCQTQASQFPGLSPELQLLKTTMTFVRLGAKSCPNLRNVALAFINRNLGDWITQQGGWERINI